MYASEQFIRKMKSREDQLYTAVLYRNVLGNVLPCDCIGKGECGNMEIGIPRCGKEGCRGHKRKKLSSSAGYSKGMYSGRGEGGGFVGIMSLKYCRCGLVWCGGVGL